MCAVLLAGCAFICADAPTRLRIVFDAAGVVPGTLRLHAISEAGRIWAKEGVSLVTSDDGHCRATDPATVTATIDVGHDTQSGDAGLGAIRFAPDGTPDSVIVLNFDAVL